jgi:hypothetical protein
MDRTSPALPDSILRSLYLGMIVQGQKILRTAKISPPGLVKPGDLKLANPRVAYPVDLSPGTARNHLPPLVNLGFVAFVAKIPM